MNLAKYILSDFREKNIYLICEGGAGKTYQLLFSCQELLRKCKSNKVIALYIPMNQYDGEDANYIQNYIIKKYMGRTENGFDESNRNAFRTMIEESDYSYFIFIDALNETSVFPDRAYTEIENISKWKNTRIVVTSRNNSDYLKDFSRFELRKLDNDYINQRLQLHHKNISKTLQELVKLPFYFKRFLDIQNKNKEQITSATELLQMYYGWLIEKSGRSLDNIGYSDFCSTLLDDFLPEFAYQQMSKVSYLVFDRKECCQKWKLFKDENDITFNKECIKVLEELGIIRKIDNKKYAFAHQDTYTYFVAKYIFDRIEENQELGDSLLVNISDEYILTFIGEFMGEHKFVDKKSLDEPKSPVELNLDKYRNDFKGSSARVVSKYVDIMRYCRKNNCTANFSLLDLRKTRLYSKQSTDYENSNFDYSKISWMGFEQPFLENDIKFVYANEEDGYVIVSDLNSFIFLLNNKLEIIDCLNLKYKMPMNYNDEEDISINISRESINVDLGLKREGNILAVETKSLELMHNKHVKYDYLISIKNGILSYSRDEISMLTYEAPVLNAMNGRVYGFGIDTWEVVSNSTTIVLRVGDKYVYRNCFVKRNIRHLLSDVSANGFTFEDGEFVEGDIAVQGESFGRIYDTKKCCSTKYYFHGGTRDDIQLCNGCFISRCPLVFAHEEEHYSKIITHADISGCKLGPEILVPIVSNFLSTSVCGKYLLVYSSGEICYSDISDFELSNIEGEEHTTEYLPFKNVRLEVPGEILFNGCKIIGEVLYVAYVNVNKEFELIMYDLLRHKVINTLTTNIYMFDMDFKKGGQTYSLGEAVCNVIIISNYIYLRIYGDLHVINVESGWHFTVSLPKINVKNVVGIHVFESGFLLFQNDDRIMKFSFKNIVEDKEYYDDKTWGELVVEEDKYVVKKMEIYDTIFKREIDNIPCIELIKECEIKYLENINLQGCSFVGATLTEIDGNETLIPEEILFNT